MTDIGERDLAPHLDPPCPLRGRVWSEGQEGWASVGGAKGFTEAQGCFHAGAWAVSPDTVHSCWLCTQTRTCMSTCMNTALKHVTTGHACLCAPMCTPPLPFVLGPAGSLWLPWPRVLCCVRSPRRRMRHGSGPVLDPSLKCPAWSLGLLTLGPRIWTPASTWAQPGWVGGPGGLTSVFEGRVGPVGG